MNPYQFPQYYISPIPIVFTTSPPENWEELTSQIKNQEKEVENLKKENDELKRKIEELDA